MGFRRLVVPQAKQDRVPDLQLAQQVSPLKLKLSGRAHHALGSVRRSYFTTIERVTAGTSLFVYGSQIRIDRGTRRPLGLKAS